MFGSDKDALKKRLRSVENEIAELWGEIADLKKLTRSLYGKYAVSYRPDVANKELKAMQALMREVLGGDVVAITGQDEPGDAGDHGTHQEESRA